jgi:hypothetical protein
VCDVDKPEVCPGEEYTVSATATNCSAGPEDIVIYIDGESQLFEDVAAGAEVSFQWTFTAPTDCEPYSTIGHVTRAVATNECNPDPGVEATCETAVTCLPEPCVEITCDVDKPEVCPGEEYTVTAAATNCSAGPEDIVIYIDGESQLFEDVGAGAEVTFQWTFTAPEDCEPLSTIEHVTRAVATNECNPETGVEATCTTAVTCQPAPCVTAACNVSPAVISNGETATITGSAMNCSAGPETIVLTIYGPDDLNAVYATQTFPDVAPGAIVTLEATWACEPNLTGIHDFRVGAVATNDCGQADAVSTEPCSVECQASLCWLTGGGNHNDNNSKGQKLFTWGGNVGPPPRGSWQHVERDGEGNILFNFHAKDMEVYQCFHDGGDGPCHPGAENNVIIFGGEGEYSIGPGGRTEQATFEVRAEDHGEPGNNPNRDGGCGSPDYYWIQVKNAATGEVVFEHGDFIDGGNLQIHPLKGNQGTK